MPATETQEQMQINLKELVKNQRRIFPENILDQKTGEQFAEASRMFDEANEILEQATTDDTYAPAVLGFASGYILQPSIIEIERGIFTSKKGSILRSILLDKERRENLYKTDNEEFNNTVKIATHILIAFDDFSHLNSLAGIPKNMLGRIGAQTGEMIINSAIKAWDDVIAIESENSLFWYMKGEVFGIIGRTEDAFNCYKKGLSMNPVDYRSAFGYAICAPIQTKKPKLIEDVIKALDVEIEKAPICDQNMYHACFFKMFLITGKKINTQTWKSFLDSNEGLLEEIVKLWKQGFKALTILERWFPSRINYQIYKRALTIMDSLYNEKLIKDVEGVHVCGFCGKDTGSLMKCLGCGVEYYCSKEHQSTHWQKHKIICKKFNEKY